MGKVTLDECKEQVVSEVIEVLRESGRDDLVGSLKAIIEDFNNRILKLVVENVNLDSCNTDLDTKNTELVLEVEGLKRVIEILEGVIRSA
jgi:hypothetical protein